MKTKQQNNKPGAGLKSLQKKIMTTKNKKQKTIDAAGALAFCLVILSAITVTTYSVITNL